MYVSQTTLGQIRKSIFSYAKSLNKGMPIVTLNSIETSYIKLCSEELMAKKVPLRDAKRIAKSIVKDTIEKTIEDIQFQRS